VIYPIMSDEQRRQRPKGPRPTELGLARVRQYRCASRVNPTCLGCGENRRRVRRKARPYHQYALRLAPARAAILAATRLAEL